MRFSFFFESVGMARSGKLEVETIDLSEYYYFEFKVQGSYENYIVKFCPGITTDQIKMFNLKKTVGQSMIERTREIEKLYERNEFENISRDFGGPNDRELFSRFVQEARDSKIFRIRAYPKVGFEESLFL